MPLEAGTHLGPYEVLEPIGKGGMGEVYRARDSKLDRDVAIKVLPDELARDEERVTRFEREAKLLASLNHANVATLYGIEESGSQQLLVMELVEGETLEERVAQGPLAVDEAIPLFVQIAEGLEAAHDKGVIHRDLKPANIKVTPEGKIKILDFGLARAFSPESEESAESSKSPTLTKGTALGAIMGTASYMSPEQARGKVVDKRTDVWAFGCCLYETLTARKAFDGETVTDILAAVVHEEPAFGRLTSRTPTGLERLLRRCLEKKSSERFHDIADVRLDLNDVLVEPRLESPPTSGRSRNAFAGMALVTAAALALAVWGVTQGNATNLPRATPVARFALALPDQELEVEISGPSVAISRDGQQFAWVARSGDSVQLYLRAASELEAKALEGTEDARSPFFSPDGRWIGFFSSSAIWKVSVSGGAPVKITDYSGIRRGAMWGANGSVVFSAGDSLRRVSAEGGASTVIAAPKVEEREKSLRFPEWLNGGEAVLFTAGSADMDTWDDATIGVLSLDTGDVRTLIEGGTNARYSSTGHIVYVRGERLFAAPFDASTLEIIGAPAVVLEPVSTFPFNGPAQFALSPSATLLYAPGPPYTSTGRVVEVSREGAVVPLVETPRPAGSLDVAPDGERFAIELQGANHSIWIFDRVRGALTPFLSGFNNFGPLWSRDGNALAWRNDERGIFDIFVVSADGAGERERLSPVDGPPAYPSSWSPDGRFLLYRRQALDTLGDLMVLPLDGDRTPRVFLSTDAEESDGRFSPGGNWVAYESDESGRFEIYLRSFPDAGSKWQVSTAGGRRPRWNPRGGELFYQIDDKMMAVAIELDDKPVMGPPRLLFDKRIRSLGRPYYEVTPDGERFIMVDDVDAVPRPRSLVVIQNFAEEIKRLAPPSR